MAPDKRLTVVHVIGAMLAGGAERFVVSLLQTLQSTKLDVRLMALSSRIDVVGNAMRNTLREAGIPCEAGPTESVGLATVVWYKKSLARIAPHIVHLHTPNTELAHFLSQFPVRSNVRLFRTLHNVSTPRHLLTVLAHRHNLAVCSIACSDAVAAASRGLVRGEIVTILNGVQFNFPSRDSALSQHHKCKLGWTHGQYHFIQVGRMTGNSLTVEQKAHDIVLAAWREGQLGKRGCILHLLGDGNLRRELQSMADGDSSVRFHGVCKDVPSYLLAADCFLMPSRYEGLPIAGIEAIGAGLPCILSSIASLKELRPPMAGWVPVDGIHALAAKMQKFAVSRPVPDKAQVEEFRRAFSITRAAERYEQAYVDGALSSGRLSGGI